MLSWIRKAFQKKNATVTQRRQRQISHVVVSVFCFTPDEVFTVRRMSAAPEPTSGRVGVIFVLHSKESCLALKAGDLGGKFWTWKRSWRMMVIVLANEQFCWDRGIAWSKEINFVYSMKKTSCVFGSFIFQRCTKTSLVTTKLLQLYIFCDKQRAE